MTIKIVGRGDAAIAVEYLVALQELAFERGIEPRQFLADSDLPVDVFIQDDIKIGNESLAQVIRNCPILLSDPMLPYDFARRLTLSRHGKLGFALNGCDTVQEAINLLIQLIDIRIQNLSLKLEVGENIGEVILVEPPVSHTIVAADQDKIGEVFVLTILCCLALMAKQLIGQLQVDRDIVIKTKYASRGVDPRKHKPALDIHYSAAFNAITFPASLLDRRPTAHNPAISRAALAECKEELLEMNAQGINFTDQVRNLIYCKDTDHWRSIDEVADALFMSASSLKRKLSQQGSSFQHIKNSERFSLAIKLLDNDRLTLENISESLGYSNASNFSKAFKTWTGYSTKQYLNKHSR